MIKITVITVVYNGAATIQKTIDSVRDQHYPNLEYLVIDGASTDNTLDIVKANSDIVTKWVSEPDEGLYYAMNKGIRMASGDVIGIINSDDWYMDGALTYVAKAFEENPEAEVVYGDLNFSEEGGTILPHVSEKFNTLSYQMSINHPATFVRRSCYERNGTFDEDFRIAADYELMLRLYSRGVHFFHLEKTITIFSLSGISNKQKELCSHETAQVRERYFDMKLFQKACVKCGILEGMHYVIYGAGFWGKKLLDLFTRIHANVDFLVDRDPSKWADYLGGVEIRPVSALKDISQSQNVLIALQANDEGVLQSIIESGVSRDRILQFTDLAACYSDLLMEKFGQKIHTIEE